MDCIIALKSLCNLSNRPAVLMCPRGLTLGEVRSRVLSMINFNLGISPKKNSNQGKIENHDLRIIQLVFSQK